MASSIDGDIYIEQTLLVWQSPISDTIADLFALVSAKLSELINYISTDLTKTDAYHVIIPLDCLKDFINDPVYKFPHIRRIDIYYDDFNDLLQMPHCLNLQCEKLQFCSIHDMPQRLLDSIKLNNALTSLNLDMINALNSSIEDRISGKSFIISASHSQLLKQFASPVVHNFPAKNIYDIDPYCICSSCQLVFQQPYQLECHHRICLICLNVQKNCTICFKVISRDKVRLDTNWQEAMRDLRIICKNCDWAGSLDVYQKHYNENHQHLLTCLIRNLQTDHDNSFQSYQNHRSVTSLNGTCIWKISGIEAMKQNRRKSIYSSSFHSFPNGYKMRLRFHLNGDVKSRGTHMSLFLVLMRSKNDINLQWPFKFQVTFTLLNHFSSNDNQSKSFWPDITSICFQDPRSDMNIPSGISECFPLDIFHKNPHHYVKNDTICIKVHIDFLTEIPVSPLIIEAGEVTNEEDEEEEEAIKRIMRCISEL